MSARVNVSRWVSSVLVLAVALVGSSVTTVVADDQRLVAQVVVPTRAAEVAGPLVGAEVRALPFAARDVAVHWRGHPDALVEIGFSADGIAFGEYEDVGRDEVGEQRRNGETYSSVIFADGATHVRVRTDRPLGRLSVLALADNEPVISWQTDSGQPAGASLAQPTVIARSGWGADESLRFDGSGNEIWPPEFFPLQKMVVHHTATRNNDGDPAATVRSIYYYHAVTQGWGDIGYSFLIDEAGRIYKGRNSHLPGSVSRDSDTITGEDGSGYVVTAGHALGVNQGSIGVAFLGTLTNQDATPAAKSALEGLLAWDAERHLIDPHGISLYVDPDGVTSNYTPTQPIPNILGHRDVNATECPGGAFYATLPAVRDAVASRLGGGGPPAAPTLASLGLNPTSVTGGSPSQGTVTLTGAAPVGGADVTLSSSNTSVATVPAVVVTGGQTSATFTVTTVAVGAVTPVTITALYTGTTKTATLTVNPPAESPADFSLSVTTPSGSVPRGSSTTYTVTINWGPGTSGPVTLSVSGLPPRSSASFNPNPTSTTSTLTISTQKKTARGTSTITVTGARGAFTHTATTTIVVT